jgi:hypothetical protein
VESRAAVWEKKTEEEILEIRRNYANRLLKAREEIMARLPLDKRRAKSEQIEALLKAAMDGYLSKLDRDRLLAILEGELRRRLGACAEFTGEGVPEGLELSFRLLSEEEGLRLFKNALPPGGALKAGAGGDSVLVKEAEPSFALGGKFPALRVNTRGLRIAASVDAAAEALLDDFRTELVSALLGDLEAILRDEPPESPGGEGKGGAL